jgi:hypothetical protein
MQFRSLSIFPLIQMVLIYQTIGSCKQRRLGPSEVQGVENLATVENKPEPAPICGSEQSINANETVLKKWLDRPGTMRAWNEETQKYANLAPGDVRPIEFRKALSQIAPSLIQQLSLLETKVSFTTSVPSACKNLPDSELFESHLKRQYFSCAVKKSGQRSPELFFGTIDSPNDFAKAMAKYNLPRESFTTSTFVIRSEAVRTVSVAYVKIIRQLLEGWSRDFGRAKLKNQTIPSNLSQLANLIEINRRDKDHLAEQVFHDLESREFFKPEAAKSLLDFKTISTTKDPNWFRDYVLIEVLDSHYCSATTRQQLEDYFPKTSAAFMAKFVKNGLE